MWCIGEIDRQYRERMYDLLDLYDLDYNPEEPVVCVDEKSKQQMPEKRTPIPSPIKRVDYEYKRNGTQNIFMAVEPKGGKRVATVTDHRKKADFAEYIRVLAEVHYAEAKVIHIVCDNLNTHFKKSFTETFGEEKAEKLYSRIQFHYTPKHASWLNAAEIEIGIMDRQCLNQRIPDKQKLIAEIEAWQMKRNQQKATIQWSFSKQDADQKLGNYYIEPI